MNENLIIIGAGGHGKVCLDIALEMNRWKDIYFLDDYCQEKEILGHKVLGTTNLIDKYKENYDFFVAIGDNKQRYKIFKNLLEKKVEITTLIHPRTTVSRFSKIGKGTVIMPGVIINSNTKVGVANIINTNSIIEHDNTLGEFVSCSPGVKTGGNVIIESFVFLGMNVVIINNIKIENHVTVGALSLVIRDVTKSGSYFGIPVRGSI